MASPHTFTADGTYKAFLFLPASHIRENVRIRTKGRHGRDDGLWELLGSPQIGTNRLLLLHDFYMRFDTRRSLAV